MSIKQLASKVIYQSKWMTVREDEIEMDSGKKSVFGVVDKSDYAVIIPYENGKIQLVEQYRYPVGGRYWELPQGALENNEENSINAAKRELAEETGLIANDIQYIGKLFQGYGYATQSFHIFFATDFTTTERKLDETEEDLITASFDLKQFERMILDQEIKDGTTVAAYGFIKMKGIL